MKRLLFTIVFFVLLTTEVFAGNIGDISNVGNAKCITDYIDPTTQFSNISTDYNTITVEEMDTVTFGMYPQSDASGNTKEPIEWIVLEKQDDKALLLSKYSLDVQYYFNPDNAFYKNVKSLPDMYLAENGWNEAEFNKAFEERKNINSSFYENSDLRQWLNNVFYNTAFTQDEKNKILDANEKKLNSNGKYSIEQTIKGKVFCLGINDIREKYGYNSPLATSPTNYAKSNNSTGYWWLSTVGNDTPNLQMTGNRYNNYPITDLLFDIMGDGTQMLKGDVRPAIWITYNQVNNAAKISNLITGMPQQESELRNDGHFYLNNKMQKSSWIYYVAFYYHVDSAGNIEKNKWIEKRYVGENGRMYRGRQTPDGKWVGDDGLVVNVSQDLSKSLTKKAAEADSWYKTESGLWYYFENDRTTTKKGWFTDTRDNQTYYLDPNTGIMALGWTNIDGKMYYFNELSAAETNWYEVGNGFYESYGKKIKALGSMYKNETTPDGKKVDENGRLVK